MTTKTMPPLPPLARDVLEAIGEPTTPRAWPTEAETGRDMRRRARAMVDAGEIRSEAEAVDLFKVRAVWLNSFKGTLSPVTLTVWLRMELQLFQSARKYLNERKTARGRV